MSEEPDNYADGWNFGPDHLNTVDVRTLTEKILREWQSGTWKIPSQTETAPHEAGFLKLDSHKIKGQIRVEPAYAIDEAVQKTIAWYREFYNGNNDMYEFSLQQVRTYMADVMKKG